MSPQEVAYREGMRFRRDNLTEGDLLEELGQRTLSGQVYNSSVIDGWRFMDRTILAQEMLEGRA